MVPREKKPVVSLPVRKLQRIEGHLNEKAMSAPTPTGGKGVDQSSPPRHAEGWSGGD